MEKSEYCDIVWDGPITSFHEGFILGNGDLGALMYGNQWELKFTLGKNDCWDARFEVDPEENLLTHDDLIRLIEEYGMKTFKTESPMWMMTPSTEKPVPMDIRTIYATPSYYLKGRFCRPCPKRVAEIVFAGPGLSTTKMRSRLHVLEGTFEVEFEYNPTAKIKLEGFIWGESNVLCLRVQVQGNLKWGDWAKLILRKYPDAVDASIPDPVVEALGSDVLSITQKIPGDGEIEPFEWTVVGKLPGARIDHRYETVVNVPKENATADYFISVSTSREVKDPKRKAWEMAVRAAAHGYDALKASQREWWSNFWSRSSVTLDDKELEAYWYRDLYFLACNLREGKQAPGLFGNMTFWDAAMWHSDYHMDKNFQKNFYPVLVTNHCEMSEPYFSAFQDSMPQFEWLAKNIFGLEGAYIDIVFLPYQPPNRIFFCNTHGRQLGLSGWSMNQFWWYYQYTKDKEWLKEKGYPIIKKVAQFYWNYLEKYQERAGGDIYPSSCLEGPDPVYRNVFQDLLFFRFAFRAAIKASEDLGVDEDWRQRWAEGLKRVPAYKISEYGGAERVVSHKDQKAHNIYTKTNFLYCGYIIGPLIFPGEDVDPESDSDLANLIREGFEAFDCKEAYSPNFLGFSLDVPAARLRLPKAYEMVRDAVVNCRYPAGNPNMFKMDSGMNCLQAYPYGLQVEDFHLPLVISELLLQSYNEVIRLFPAWPKEKSATFTTLRAEGGFLVSSSLEKGEVGPTRIHSTVGGTCRVQCPWAGIKIFREEDGAEVAYKAENNIVSFETQPGQTYIIKQSKTD